MPRATGPRIDTEYYGEGSRPLLVPAKIKSGAMIYALTLVALTAQGELVSAAEPDAVYAVGRVDQTYDNTADQMPRGEYRRGVFRWETDGSILPEHVGKKVAIVDDQTVKLFADGDKLAGVVLFTDDRGIWIETAPELALT